MALADGEIVGSRNERQGQKMSEGTMLYVIATVADVPVCGTTFFTDEDAATESGVTGRVCYQYELDPDILPGIIFVTAHFRGFNAMA